MVLALVCGKLWWIFAQSFNKKYFYSCPFLYDEKFLHIYILSAYHTTKSAHQQSPTHFFFSHTKHQLKVRTCLLLPHFSFLHVLFSNSKYLAGQFSQKTYFNCCSHVTLQNKTKSLHLSPLFFCEVNKNKRVKLSKTPSYNNKNPAHFCFSLKVAHWLLPLFFLETLT